MDPDEYKTEFRFRKYDIVCSQGTICSGIEGLYVLLREIGLSKSIQRLGSKIW